MLLARWFGSKTEERQSGFFFHRDVAFWGKEMRFNCIRIFFCLDDDDDSDDDDEKENGDGGKKRRRDDTERFFGAMFDRIYSE